jgi:hypothetical protein
MGKVNPRLTTGHIGFGTTSLPVKKASGVGGPLWALDDKAQTVRTQKTSSK